MINWLAKKQIEVIISTYSEKRDTIMYPGNRCVHNPFKPCNYATVVL